MTAYRPRYDERLPAIERAIDAMPGSIDVILPGFSRARLKRFFQRFSVLLGRLDRKGAKHPQYLSHRDKTVPDALLAYLDEAIANLGNGAASFIQTSLDPLIAFQDRLERAVGADADEIKALSLSTAADLASAAANADEFVDKARSGADAVNALQQKVDAQQPVIAQMLERAQADVDKIAATRRTVEGLVSPDGRTKSSLEALARQARQKASEISDLHQTINEQATSVSTLSKDSENALSQTREVFKQCQAIQAEAERILNLSSQAGLAASYSRESKSLELRAGIFTAVLYVTALLTLGIAAFWVIPELEKAIGAKEGEFAFWEAASLTLLRASVLAPLIYILYFTTKRVSALETLRMDYAEKAAASLAYSGYREQMTNDGDLLKQLKGSLLLKFAEHPERLLRVADTSTRARVVAPGFEAETEVRSSSGDKLTVKSGTDDPTA